HKESRTGRLKAGTGTKGEAVRHAARSRPNRTAVEGDHGRPGPAARESEGNAADRCRLQALSGEARQARNRDRRNAGPHQEATGRPAEATARVRDVSCRSSGRREAQGSDNPTAPQITKSPA